MSRSPTRRPRWMAILALSGGLLLATELVVQRLEIEISSDRRAAAAEPEMTPDVQLAVNRAIEYLKAHASTTDSVPGRAVVGALALLKAGLPEQEPAVQRVIQFVLKRVVSGNWQGNRASDHIYDAGVSIMLLGTADSVKYRPEMEAIVRYILSQQGRGGDWDYPDRTNGDTSITQYAVLGLWEATRAGIEVPLQAWDRVAAWHIRHQLRSGGFVYHPTPGIGGSDAQALHTMTVAACGSLLVAKRHLFPGNVDLPEETVATDKKLRRTGKRFGVLELADEEPEAATVAKAGPYVRTVSLVALNGAIQRGIEWVRKNYTIRCPTEWRMYYVYGYERLAALYGDNPVPGSDWYAEGAAYLQQIQRPDGSWEDSCSSVPATGFGVMFLIKATAKLVKPQQRKTVYGEGLLVGGRGLPDDLSTVKIAQGEVKVRKPTGPVDELLARLEATDLSGIDEVQTDLVDKISLEEVRGLVGQKDRLRKLVQDKRPEIRRTAYWALGRTDDLDVGALLIAGLSDNDPACLIEARNALQFLSRKPMFLPATDTPTAAEREHAIVAWKKWYATVRPYAKRDDLAEGEPIKATP